MCSSEGSGMGVGLPVPGQGLWQQSSSSHRARAKPHLWFLLPCSLFFFFLLLLFKIYLFYECFACRYVCIVYPVSKEVRRHPVPWSYSCELPCECKN